MMRRGEKAFTVAELLVTIAIIAVLAAMVVPVFEARSEEARSLTCQSNMQRIVTAIRMYMADHDDTLPPREHRPEVLAYFDTTPGGRHWYPSEENPHCRRADQANPYLRWPVVLDSYLASRDVWQCPSATIVSGAAWIIPGPDWLGHLQAYEGMWGTGTGGGPCYLAWPKGWGGTVTDSIPQQQLAVPLAAAPLYGTVASGAFVQSIGINSYPELTMYEVIDPSVFVIVGDGGVMTGDMSAGLLAYPEICALECSGVCGWADWELCADSAADCGLFRYAPNNGSMVRYVSQRMPYARHRARFGGSVPLWERNGVNVGFLDGHVAFMASEDIISKVKDGELEGVKIFGPTSTGDDQSWQDCFPDGVTLF